MKELIDLLKSNLEKAEAQLRMIACCSCIENCNSIVMFPNGTTIDSENGRPVINSGLFASQFTQKVAAELVKNITNGANEKPFIIAPKEYYSLKVKEYTDLLNLLNK